MAKRATLKLKKVLDRHQGKDYGKIKQQMMRKAADKRKKVKTPADEELHEEDGDDEGDEVLVTGDNEDDEIDGAEVDAFLKSLGGEDGGDDNEEWATDDEEVEDDEDEEEGGYDMSRLEDSDSDESDSELDIPQPKKAVLAKAAKVTPAAKPSSTKPLAPVPTAEDVDEDDEDEDEEEGIPLSDIESLGSGSDEADIIPHQRLTINNTSALTRALEAFALPLSTLPFSEHQSITTAEPTSIPDAEDDLARELAFYAQSLAAVKEARLKLRKEGHPFTRPTDYFAEMVKSDEHMGKIKAKLVDDAASKKASQDARRQRDLKKFGKQVQQEKLKERAAAKKDMLDKVNLLKRKRQGEGLQAEKEDDIFDVALEDEVTTARKDRDARKAGGVGKAGGKKSGSGGGERAGRDGNGQANPKRARKNEKYGFGGKKRFGKSGDAESSGDMTGFSTKRMKGKASGGGGGKKFSAPRPGKSKRDSRK